MLPEVILFSYDILVGYEQSQGGIVMGKSLDDLFDKLAEFAERVETRLEKIEHRLDQHDLRFEQLEKRMDRQEALLFRVEEMTADLIQKVGYTNTRIDEIQETLQDMGDRERFTSKTITFPDNKVWEHEKQLFMLRERMETYEKS